MDYEAAARRALDASVFAYLESGASSGAAAARNRAAFDRWSIYPRPLRDMSEGHTRVGLAGKNRPHPFFLAPVAFQKLAHAEGEFATARAAQATDTCMIASTLSSVPLEAIAATGADRWFQLYLQPAREASLALVRRAEAAGYEAIVLTVDAPVQPLGHAALRAGFRLPADCVAANLTGTPGAAPKVLDEGQSRVFQGAMHGAPTWADVEWLVSNTSLPVWIKGVMHPDDARAACSKGAAGLVVSNHGGRALESAPASLDVLPEVRAAVGPDFPLLFDGGIRSGSDAFKAIALGADGVLVGRLQVYALAAAGALGVAHVLRLLREELELCMALAGCASPDDIRPEALRPC